MSDNLQFIVTGLATGSVYALVGLGIVLVHQVTGIINFAQGEFVMVGALTFALLNEKGLGLVPAALSALAITVVVGVLVERLAIAPARKSTIERLIILTIGASIAIQGITLVVIGTSPHFASAFTAGAPYRIGGVVILRQYLWVFAVTALAVVTLWYFLTRTLTGKAMRAAAMNRDAARLVAVSPSRMSLLAFVLAALLGAIGGIVLAPLQAPSAGIGIALGLKGFTAAVLGGLNSPAGAIAGGLLIGVIESIAAGYLPSGYKDAIAFGILFLVLLIRPNGLLRRASSVRV
ncbi:MAG: branched-chain amino acid ABC transporter permease [Actinomycetota bacterium]|nr:branched-chain amino acid ABC transporter permease [Actinomycetota bacterium]